jgi:hypothetical protein
MCETLRKGTVTTVPAEHDCAKEHLDPSQHRIRHSDDTVYAHSQGTHRPLVDVQLEVHSQRKLRGNRNQEDIGKLAMRARKKFSASVRVPENVAP